MATRSSADAAHLTSETPVGAALCALERGDARHLLAVMRTLGPQAQDGVLKHVVVRALDRDAGLAPLQAMTMLLPRRADLHTGLGFAHLVRENHAAAERSFRRALALDGTAAAALLGCGVALRTLGRAEAAADFLMRALGRTDQPAITQAAAVALRDLLDEPAASAAGEVDPADGEPIPWVAGTAATIFIY